MQAAPPCVTQHSWLAALQLAVPQEMTATEPSTEGPGGTLPSRGGGLPSGIPGDGTVVGMVVLVVGGLGGLDVPVELVPESVSSGMLASEPPHAAKARESATKEPRVSWAKP